MAMTATSAMAQDAGNAAAIKVGIDPITIITIISSLLPVIANLFKGCQQASPTTATDPKAFLEDHYDEDSGGFDDHLLAQIRRHTRREARLNGQGRLRIYQLDAISAATLEKARTADDAAVAAVMSEA